MDNITYIPSDIIRFWFNEIEPKYWWIKNTAFDDQIRTKFGTLLEQAKQGELSHWRITPEGRLAEIIILDQFSRHIHRGTAAAFATDQTALVLAQEAIASTADTKVQLKKVPFFYMPYMHSESRQIHKIALVLFQRRPAANNLKFEQKHKAIIDRFDRYPHRNEILGRRSTNEEIAFLQQPDSRF